MPISAEILSNPKSERIRRTGDLANRKGRERSARFLIEGPQSVREAIAWHPEIVRDLYVQVGSSAPDAPFVGTVAARLAGQAVSAGIYVHKVTPEVMARISSDAQGIAAVGDLAAMRAAMRYDPHGDASVGSAGRKSDESTGEDSPFVAAFWQVRDPGNAGTVIRAADAAGCDAVVFVDECVDMFNPKVIRSTVGSLFHLPVLTMGTDAFLAWAGGQGMEVIAADVYGIEGRPPESLPDVLAEDRAPVRNPLGRESPVGDAGGRAVLFGNEARGLPAALLAQSGRIVSIPMYGKAESLNLGTSAAVMLMSMAMSSRLGRM